MENVVEQMTDQELESHANRVIANIESALDAAKAGKPPVTDSGRLQGSNVAVLASMMLTPFLREINKRGQTTPWDFILDGANA